MRSEFETLAAEGESGLAGMTGVPMIATHPRYQYVARRYDLSITALEWEAGAMPTDAEVADLQTMIGETGARVLIWEAEPPAAAFEITAALGLQNVVFPTLAHGLEGRSFTQAYNDAIAAMASVEVE